MTDFYVVATEPGAEHPAIPTWANDVANPAKLELEYVESIKRIDIAAVPGTFQLLDVLSGSECQRLVDLSESLGYLQHAAVSLPRSVRHNDSVTWVIDDNTNDLIWSRCAPHITDCIGIFFKKKALGLNARFRFYRYQRGDYFSPHTDGSWPGSRVVDGNLVSNAYPDRWSLMSFLLFLSDEYEGGSTQFYVNKNNPAEPVRGQDEVMTIDIRTPVGAVLCFPHGTHALHRMHGSEAINSGTKYIIRSDVLFEL